MLEVDGKAPVMLSAGDAFEIDVAMPHNVSTRRDKLTVISVYLVEKGKPLAEPAYHRVAVLLARLSENS